MNSTTTVHGNITVTTQQSPVSSIIDANGMVLYVVVFLCTYSLAILFLIGYNIRRDKRHPEEDYVKEFLDFQQIELRQRQFLKERYKQTTEEIQSALNKLLDSTSAQQKTCPDVGYSKKQQSVTFILPEDSLSSDHRKSGKYNKMVPQNSGQLDELSKHTAPELNDRQCETTNNNATEIEPVMVSVV